MAQPDQPDPGADPDEVPNGEPPAESIVPRFEPLSWTAEAAARAKTGDREALGELYRRHYERVRRCAAMSMGKTLRRCEADIEDVVHEAFVEAFDRLLAGQFDETRSAGGFRSWLSMICVNKVRGRGAGAQAGQGSGAVARCRHAWLAQRPHGSAGLWAGAGYASRAGGP